MVDTFVYLGRPGVGGHQSVMRCRWQGQVASVLAKKPEKYWMPLSLSPTTQCVPYIRVSLRRQAGHRVTSGPAAPEGQSSICRPSAPGTVVFCPRLL